MTPSSVLGGLLFSKVFWEHRFPRRSDDQRDCLAASAAFLWVSWLLALAFSLLCSQAPPAVSGVLCNVNIWIILSIVFYQLCFAEVSIWTILVRGTTINMLFLVWMGEMFSTQGVARSGMLDLLRPFLTCNCRAQGLSLPLVLGWLWSQSCLFAAFHPVGLCGEGLKWVT